MQEVSSLFVDSRDQSGIYVVSRKGLFFSKNDGDFWQDITPDKDHVKNNEEFVAAPINVVLSVAGFKTQPSLLLAGSDAGLFISRDNGKFWKFIDLGESGNSVSQENFKMDLPKLVTEIHTGRFFGSYFYWLVDLSTFGMIALAISGLMVVVYRNKMKKGKASKKAMNDADIDIDQKIKIVESADDLSMDSQNIHDMVEHINQHLQRCRSIYSISKEKEEIEKISRHILNLDKKMHYLMEHIDGLAKLAQDMGVNDSPPTEPSMRPEEHSEVPDKTART